MQFDGEIALVTGAAGGLGRAISLALAHAGARVAMTDRHADGLTTTATEVAAVGRPGPGRPTSATPRRRTHSSTP